MRSGVPSLPSLAMALLVLAWTSGELAAQHPTRGAIPPDQDNCMICHGAHGRGRTGTLLRQPGSAGVPAELDPASRTCLRCHSTPELRGRQPEFAERLPTDGAFLGPTLLDDHPMGRPGAPGDPDGYGVPRPGAGGSLRVEIAPPRVGCTACHDAHSRTGVPTPSEQVQLCGGCHMGPMTAPGHPSLACSDCHRMHGSMGRGLVGTGGVDGRCRTCHGLGATGQPSAGPAAVSRVGPEHYPGPESCTTCHPVHPDGFRNRIGASP